MPTSTRDKIKEILEVAQQLVDDDYITQKDYDFITSIRKFKSLSEKQLAWLNGIYDKA